MSADIVSSVDGIIEDLYESGLDNNTVASCIRDLAAEIVRLRGEVCSCPSGDGSLRWPCKAHPPEAIALAEAKGDAYAACCDTPAYCSSVRRCTRMDTPQPAGGEAVRMNRPQLWCLHILGPDEVHAAPSKAHAEQAVAIFNATFPHGEGEVRVEAIVAPWPHSAESHAESVAEFIPNWLLPRWQVEALTKNTPQPADGGAVAQRPKFIVDRMVSAFLSWRLPQDFRPDNGVAFAAPDNPSFWPSGTNLFNADQAKAMVEHMLGSAIARDRYSTEEEGDAFTDGYFTGADEAQAHPTGDALGAVRETFEVPRHYVENLLSAACLLELSGNGVDKREAAVLRNIAGLALQHRGDSRGGEASGGAA